jgi:hypothetical protein
MSRHFAQPVTRGGLLRICEQLIRLRTDFAPLIVGELLTHISSIMIRRARPAAS